MSDFYSQSSEQQIQQIEKLVRTALPLWGIDSHAQINLLKFRENAVYGIETETERFALRVHRPGYHSDASLLSELQWMDALNNAGIKTPDVIPANDGALFKVVQINEVPEPRQIDILGWVDGDALGSIEEGASGDVETITANYQIVGQLMAKLHNQAQHWEKPADFTRHAWDLDGMLGENPFWGQFWKLNVLNDEQRELIQRARTKARAALESFGQDDSNYGLIHCDFLPENLLRCDDGIRLIDFDDSGFGWHLFDIATTLFFHVGEDYFNSLLDAFVRGYRSERELPDAHLALLPTFLMIRSLVYLGWLHTRPEIEEAKEMIPVLVEAAEALATDFLSD